MHKIIETTDELEQALADKKRIEVCHGMPSASDWVVFHIEVSPYLDVLALIAYKKLRVVQVFEWVNIWKSKFSDLPYASVYANKGAAIRASKGNKNDYIAIAQKVELLNKE